MTGLSIGFMAVFLLTIAILARRAYKKQSIDEQERSKREVRTAPFRAVIGLIASAVVLIGIGNAVSSFPVIAAGVALLGIGAVIAAVQEWKASKKQAVFLLALFSVFAVTAFL